MKPSFARFGRTSTTRLSFNKRYLQVPSTATPLTTNPVPSIQNVNITSTKCSYIHVTAACSNPTNTLAHKSKDEEGLESGTIPADELKSVGQHSEHEHAVISAFDLFSIGGMLKSLHPVLDSSSMCSGSEFVAHCRTDEGWKDIYQ